jgi:hypothetical protein
LARPGARLEAQRGRAAAAARSFRQSRGVVDKPTTKPKLLPV